VPRLQVSGNGFTPGHDHRLKIDDLRFGAAEHSDRHSNDAAMNAVGVDHGATWQEVKSPSHQAKVPLALNRKHPLKIPGNRSEGHGAVRFLSLPGNLG